MGRKKFIKILIVILIIFCLILKYETNNNYLELEVKRMDKISKVIKIPSENEMILEIPKINIFKTLVDKDSKYNDVNYNIETLKYSTNIEDENSLIILASHSGTSKVSFFKNLNKLEIGDKIYIYFKSTKYEYETFEYNEQEKSGLIRVKNYLNEDILILTTCKPQDKTKQLIYISKLVNKIGIR